MRHVIDAVAAQGRGDDTELLHVTKKELAGLDAFKRSRTGSGLPRNPRTGLKEAGWFDQYVAPVLPAVAGGVAGVATLNPVVGAGVGAATGAALKGAQGASTQDVLMGGVMGGISGYGAGAMGAGLAGGAAGTAGTTGTTAATTGGAATPAADVATPAFTSGAESFGGSGAATISEAAPATSYMDAAQSVAPPAETSPFAQFGGGHQGNPFQNIPNLAQETPAVQGYSMPNASTPPPTETPTNWDYLKSDKALSDTTKIGTGTLGMYAMAPGDTTTDDTGVTVNKTLPKAEVYYTPYGERRTRIAAAEGGLMSMNGAYGDYDGAESGVGIRRYAGGGGIGFIESMQPGGKWGDITTDAYITVNKNEPQWLKDAQPGGFIGATQPGRLGAEKRVEDENRRKQEEAAGMAALQKAQQEQQTQDYWKERYGIGMAEGGYTGPRDGDAVAAIVRASKPKEENAFEHPAIRKIAGQNVTQADFDAWNASRQEPNAFESPAIRHIAGQNVTQADVDSWNARQRGYAGGGIANIAAAKGRYLQGPGDGMSDSIPASIDGKQEARLATGEFVVPADVVSHLGNGDSNAGAKQLHKMMDRARMTRTGTKKQGKQINPRKVMPT